MIKKYRIFVVYALLIAAALFVHLHGDVAVPVNRPLVDIPQRQDGWRMVSESRFDDQVLKALKPTDYLSRSYVDEEGSRVGLYLGYPARTAGRFIRRSIVCRVAAGRKYRRKPASCRWLEKTSTWCELFIRMAIERNYFSTGFRSRGRPFRTNIPSSWPR